MEDGAHSDMNPSEGRIPDTQIDVRVGRDMQLPGRVWCSDRPRALIGIVHGLGEHSGRYAALAEVLVDRRFTVVALDLPGHGQAPGRRGDFPSWEFVRDQALPSMFTITRGIPGQPPDLPVVLLGHSLGAVLALDYCFAHPKTLLGVVGSAPAIRNPPPPLYKQLAARIAMMIAPDLPFPHGLDESGMSRDPEVLEHRKTDPLLHRKITPRAYYALVAAQKRVRENARKLSVPTLLLQGGADRVIDPRGALEFNGAAPHGMTRLFTYKDTYHELFNDPLRGEAIRDLLGWLDALVVV